MLLAYTSLTNRLCLFYTTPTFLCSFALSHTRLAYVAASAMKSTPPMSLRRNIDISRRPYIGPPLLLTKTLFRAVGLSIRTPPPLPPFALPEGHTTSLQAPSNKTYVASQAWQMPAQNTVPSLTLFTRTRIPHIKPSALFSQIIRQNILILVRTAASLSPTQI